MTTVTTQSGQSDLLRRALKANSMFCAASGAGLAMGAQPVAAFLGSGAPWLLVVLGVILVLYAADLWYVATRPSINRTMAIAAIVLDVAWVVGSYFIVLGGWPALTVGGKWAVAIVADIVALFAIVQYIGLRRQ